MGTLALHVPLVVEGVASLERGVVETAVELRNVRQSLLCWALREGCPASLAAPQGSDSGQEPIFGIWSDESAEMPGPLRDQLGIPRDRSVADQSRAACGQGDPVFGELVSLIRYPMKMNWRGDLDPTLHDLSWDPLERSDLLTIQPEVARRLARSSGSAIWNESRSDPDPDPDPDDALTR